MGIIVPSILVRTKQEIEDEVSLVAGLADTIQLDVVDGLFASPSTWPYAEGGLDLLPADIHELGDFRFEVDLMVARPRETMGAFLRAGAGRLVIHAESTPNIGAVLDELETTYGRDKAFSADLLSVGISVRIGTEMAIIEPYLPRIDFVQFMGIASIGAQGHPFDARVIEKLRAFKKAHPEMQTQVDGGVSLETAPALLAAGADRLIVGSALWKSEDVHATLRAFEELTHEYGRYR